MVFEKLRIEFEHKDKYLMGLSQLAQIDCRNNRCRYYEKGGECSNISPAITLNPDGTYTCWSYKKI